MNAHDIAPEQSRWIDRYGIWLFIIATAVMLRVSQGFHYLLFHALAEFVAITVSFSLFTMTWASGRHLKSSYLTILGAAYGTIGLVDIFHTLTFRGMNLFPGVTTNHPTQLWLIARFIEALALLIAPLAYRRDANFGLATLGFAVLGVIGCVAVGLGVVPATFVDGVGLTDFKIYSEYVIVFMLVVGLVLLWHIRHEFPQDVFRLVLGSVLLAIATEVCFVHYVGFYDFANALGHYLRFLSVVLVYLAIVVTGVRRPAALLSRQVHEKERELAVANRHLRDSEERLTKAQSVAGVGSWHLDIATSELIWSAEAYQIFGVEPGSPLTLDVFVNSIHPDDREAVLDAWKAALGGARYDIEHRVIVRGEVRWVRERAEVQFGADGQPLIGIGTVQNITDLKLAELRIRQLAYFDNLTGLPNRLMLLDRLSHSLSQAKRFKRAMAIMFLDLDNFKQVNDTLGHDAGDALLQEVATRLSACMRSGDTVARQGGDEFIFVLTEITHPDDASRVAQKIIDALREPVMVKGQPLQTSASIGIAVYPVDGTDDGQEMMKKADKAMYAAKQAGRNRFAFY